ncbi:GNAT family N-acetyltransferase [Halovivax gelatinilyticus]|uniref:GNAT family N-acetyltransferase n=1 Tax=Halovivax gelatinilyticus TaxID=2961597 RepID=UPI0020CA3427|nr:GNAT family N-acetyltransferase [Halovivax gelatinilyticus]
MEFREATTDDSESLRSIAADSLAATYTTFLSESTIEDALEQWYATDAITDLLESDDSLVLVAVDDEPVAFSQCEIVGDEETVGQIHWLHVHPDARGEGLGSRLFTRTREELLDVGAEVIHGFVLAENEFGNRFYEEHGFEHAGTRSIQVGGDTYTENVYTESAGEPVEWRSLEQRDVGDGSTIYVSFGEPARGSLAPFYSAYETDSGTDRYGWYCGNCESFDNAMDAMGRIKCNACGNQRKATRWDASYL